MFSRVAGQRIPPPFNMLLKKCCEWFDRLTTNGERSMISGLAAFALSSSTHRSS